ncbi:MAG: ABC transporter permease subunit [Proteobacteria bacterium]|nr:ABC transporter permease subunit [Pseudomonadota bacterium]MCP4917319.1 ABC transporter permease subunit [Pseudomonadota bacterium]
MKRLFAIAHNTFRETIRDRILTALLFFGVLVLLTSVAMEEVTIGDADHVVRSVALGAIRVFGSIIAMFLGIGLVYKELERKTIYTIASKPIPRWIFVVGKYLGLMAVVSVMVLLMALVYMVVMTLQQGFPGFGIAPAIFLLLIELALLTAWAILFSTYSSPTVASLFTMAIFVIGHMADDIWIYGMQADSESVQQLAGAVYWVLPNFSVFNVFDQAVHSLPIEGTRVLWSTLYGLGYSAAVLAAGSWIFQRRDFK